MSEFTPGPWKQDNFYHYPGWLNEMIGSDGTHVVCFGHDYNDSGMFGHPAMSDPNNFSDDEWNAAIGVAAANVRLIAAAPDLYEALLAFWEHETDYGMASWDDIKKMVPAALAKARGEDN